MESLGHRVTGIARTHTEAVALARRKIPGLVLADIQLADGSSGLDAVNELIESVEVPRHLHPFLSLERFLTGVWLGLERASLSPSCSSRRRAVAAVISQALYFETQGPAPLAAGLPA